MHMLWIMHDTHRSIHSFSVRACPGVNSVPPSLTQSCPVTRSLAYTQNTLSSRTENPAILLLSFLGCTSFSGIWPDQEQIWHYLHARVSLFSLYNQ